MSAVDSILMASLLAAPWGGSITLDPAPLWAAADNVGIRAHSVVMLDVDRDGLLDAVVGGVSPGNTYEVAILRGRPGARFARPTTFPAFEGFRGLAAGDFNRDSIQDLVLWGGHQTPNQPAITLRIMLGDGNGCFAVAWDGLIGSRPVALDIGDLDGDDILDLVVADEGGDAVITVPQRIHVLRGNGSGQFSTLWSKLGRANDIDLADIDGDGLLDLVLPSTSHLIDLPGNTSQGPGGGSISPEWLRGLGDGHFQPPRKFITDLVYGNLPVHPTDIDGDGDTDIILTAGTEVVISLVQTGLHSGLFESVINILPSLASAGSHSLVADVSGDQLPDVLHVSNGFGTNRLLVGAGDGTFASELPFNALSSWGGSKLPAVADLDGDGATDILTFDQQFQEVVVLRGAGGGVMLAPEAMSMASPAGFSTFFNTVTRAVALGDLDGDSKPDMAVAVDRPTTDPHAPSLVCILPGDEGFIAFPAATSFEIGARPRDLIIADANLDGAQDLILLSGTEGEVQVLLGDGRGDFAPLMASSVGQAPQSMATLHVNADAFIDLVVANAGTQDLTLLSGVGNGLFRRQQTIALAAAPEQVAASDLDRDGITDLIVLLPELDSVHVLRGLSSGAFSAARAFPVGANPRGLAVADLDGDGWADLATANLGSSDISLRFGSSTGFGPMSQLPLSRAPRTLIAAHLDGDETLDLAVTHGFTSFSGSGLEPTGDGSVSVLKGLGAGLFAPARRHAASAGTYSLAAGDLDGDGLGDLVVGSAGYVTRLRHTPVTWNNLGHASPSSTLAPHLVALEAVDEEGTLRLRLSGAAPQSMGLLLFGIADVTNTGIGSGLLTRPHRIIPLTPDAHGNADIVISMTAGPFVDAPRLLQFWQRSTIGVAASNVLLAPTAIEASSP